MAFMECAKRSRKETRDLVLVLDFRALQELSQYRVYQRDFNKFETIISYEWVARHQTMFANLRFLVLDGLRVGEEATEYSENPYPHQPVEIFMPVTYSCRGICIDATTALSPPAAQAVMYLDISYTYRPEHWTRVMQETNFRSLRVLKLSGMRLTDRMFPSNLLTQSGLRLWSLDVSNNLLTDRFISDIVCEHGIAPYQSSFNQTEQSVYRTDDECLYENVPLYTRDDRDIHHPPYDQLVSMRDDSLDGFAKYVEANGDMETNPRHALPVDDIYTRSTGLTHLYLSRNKLTSAVLPLSFNLQNRRLQTLDLGSPHATSSLPVSQRLPHSTSFAVPNHAHLFTRAAGSRIQTLHIHHSLVTLVPTIVPSSLHQGYLPERLAHAERMSELEPRTWGEPFRPQDNYRVSELTLTDIPTRSYGTIIKRLTVFLQLCYDQETALDHARRNPAQNHYRAPPLLPGLRVLRLEFLPAAPSAGGGFVAAGLAASVSGDTDAETASASAVGDFSFFAEERLRVGLNALVGKGDVQKGDARSVKGVEGESEVEREPRDVIEELKKFRQVRPRWSGKLEIVRSRQGT